MIRQGGLPPPSSTTFTPISMFIAIDARRGSLRRAKLEDVNGAAIGCISRKMQHLRNSQSSSQWLKDARSLGWDELASSLTCVMKIASSPIYRPVGVSVAIFASRSHEMAIVKLNVAMHFVIGAPSPRESDAYCENREIRHTLLCTACANTVKASPQRRHHGGE